MLGAGMHTKLRQCHVESLLVGLIAKLANRLELAKRLGRRLLARSKGVQLGHGVIICRNVEFRFTQSPGLPRRINIGDRVQIESGSILDSYGGVIEIGNDTYIGPGCIIYGHGGVTIGTDCLISPHCLIFSSNHGIPGPGRRFRSVSDDLARTSIASDCWLGSGTSVMAGVSIGQGAMVGSGSVVTANIAEYTMANGVPAKSRGSRRDNVDPQDRLE